LLVGGKIFSFAQPMGWDCLIVGLLLVALFICWVTLVTSHTVFRQLLFVYYCCFLLFMFHCKYGNQVVYFRGKNDLKALLALGIKDLWVSF
jgi:hypothetical protein